jgi:hypothetical protein
MNKKQAIKNSGTPNDFGQGKLKELIMQMATNR